MAACDCRGGGKAYALVGEHVDKAGLTEGKSCGAGKLPILCSYGERFVVLERAVGSDQYERLTLKHIRNLTAPGDKVLMLKPIA